MSERAVVLIRSSQGDSAKESLREQREVLPRIACSLVDCHASGIGLFGTGAQVEIIDIGIHTGFSTYTRNPNEYDGELLDQNGDIQTLLAELKTGKFQYVIGKDKNRISRDDFFNEIKRAATVFGNAEFVLWKDDNEVDSVGSSVEHLIARKQKEQEIEDAIRAIERKKERGDDLGRPKYGYTYNNAKTAQVPGDDFRRALRVLSLRDGGATYREIEDETGIGQGTIANILSRREAYLTDAEEYSVEYPSGLETLRQ
ncbi:MULTISPECIES: resolvase [Haloferax]|uniref:Resolvase n=1 Tax=Haloferax marinum TaxID=2666143 RepID=A0A6A8G9B9_9EURY|nr:MULTISPECIES: resolvase [Haloferax]KAB1198121.1 resolvase [Haloferax sp. CBA1150]MRW97198.1 resolvase [Haloferax marinum]